MNITKVTVKKEENNESKVKGYAIVELNNMFVIRDIRIIGGEKGLFIAMPSRKMTDGKYKDICYPINADGRELFNKAILEEYNKVV